MQRKLPLPIGRTNYKQICDTAYYVDKTLLVKDILDDGAGVILFTRPRRFGKTLNMDMLRTFFEKTDEDTGRYFEDKKIWEQGERYTCDQGKYPVVFLSLKDIKASDWEVASAILKLIIRDEFSRHVELVNSTKVVATDISFYKKIIGDTATAADYMMSLRVLSRMLTAHYGLPAVIIIDEYDTPIQEGYLNGYYQQAVEFTRNFFSAAFKDNPHVALGVLTGILRVAKESIFSGLNNVRVYSVLSRRFSEYFGFTGAEVLAMAEYYNATDNIAELKEWYDGYQFGGTDIYNPWSVCNYFSNYCEAVPYWVQTSGNVVIREILANASDTVNESLRTLLNGHSLEYTIETNIIYPRIKDTQTNIFGFLLMTGYLKATDVTIDEDGAYVCRLEIPNKEIKSIYRKEILALLTDNIGESTVDKLRVAILHKDADGLKTALRKFMLETISYYDGLQESYYQGLLLGMSVLFERSYYPLSNRESGEGRYDLQLMPKTKDLPGIIIEIKAAREASEEQLKQLAQKALMQIKEKHYDIELQKQDISIIHKYGIAFCGKKVEIVVQ